MDKQLNQAYWEARYASEQTGWDAGEITTPIKEYVDQLTNKQLKILIPGAGNAHEASYLHQQGFSEVYVCDWAAAPLEQLKHKQADFPAAHLIQTNFFDLDLGDFDMILEQTFFCALSPQLRKDYVQKMYELLKPNGKLVGLLFNFPLSSEGPPFGGSLEEYQNLFNTHFTDISIHPAYNSIPPRAGSEFFIQIRKS